MLKDNVVGSALTKDQTSHYNAQTNRCDVELTVLSAGFSKNYVNRNLFDDPEIVRPRPRPQRRLVINGRASVATRRHRLQRHAQRDVQRRQAAEVAIAIRGPCRWSWRCGSHPKVLDRDRARIIGEGTIASVGDLCT